jgi:hypothetical protein
MRHIRLLTLGFCVFACGGPAAPPATGPAASGDPKPADPPASADASPAATPGSIEDLRESFVKSCMDKSQSKDYCTCAFEQFKVVFKDADLSKDLQPDDPRMQQLKTQTLSACASKLTEAEVKETFILACVEGDKRKESYCTCAWTSLRKKLAYQEFVGMDAENPRFKEQSKVMVVECKGKYPAEVAKFDFMQACTHGESPRESSCACKWGKLTKQFSTEEIVAGTADIASVKGLGDCK